MATAVVEDKMFCFQCEQTARGTGCTVQGVCTKTPEVAALQDELIAVVKKVCCAVQRAKAVKGFVVDHATKVFIYKAIFSTLTNVNFSPEDFDHLVDQAAALLIKLSEVTKDPKDMVVLPKTRNERLEMAKGKTIRINKRFDQFGKDIACVQELTVYGIKGLAAYALHASDLGSKGDEVVIDYIVKALSAIEEHPEHPLGFWLELALECGAANLKATELLDGVNTGTYGHPEPTVVRWAKTPLGLLKGKCILVSGHDLLVLENVLKASKDKGISVYTHGEMLACNAYPKLKEYKNLAGHYGTAWQNQKKEFLDFPGPILMTTNCYVPAPDTYLKRVFSCDPVGGVGVTRVSPDFKNIVDSALAAPGAPSDPVEDHKLTIGFAHHTVLGAAGVVIDAVKSGALKHIFLIGGCDGYEKERNYYTELAEIIPNDCLILTLACGKFKINMKDYGTLGGLPRLMDMGQCNDSYSAIVVAKALADAFKTDVNSLPLSIVLSWFEQKAVAVLLTLLHLGIKNIRVGPRVPAFFTPDILKVLNEKFGLMPVGNAEEDLKAMLKK